MDSKATVMDGVDTTNTPFASGLIDVTAFVIDVVLGWIVVELLNSAVVDSLVSCSPSINFTVNDPSPVAERCSYAVPILSHGISLHPHVSISSPSLDDDTYTSV